MSQYIKIEGKLASLIEERAVRSVSVDDWLAQLTAQTPQTTPLLPQGCRLYARTAAGVESYVIEQAPARRTLTWKSMRPWGDAAKPDHKWRLAFPYVILIVQPMVPRVYAFYRNAPLSNAEGGQKLLQCNLGNIYLGAQNVCLATQPREFNALTDPLERVSRLVGSFWSSEFNADLLDHFLAAARKDKRVETLMKWEEESAANPLFPLEVEWLDAARTISQVIGAAGGEG